MIPLPALAVVVARALGAAGPCDRPAPSWIWCDDFEQDRRASYFEVQARGGSFARQAGVGRNGSWGMRAQWRPGQVDAGALHLAFGRTPQRYFRPADAGKAVYREIYWRVWLWRAPGWTGGGGHKLARAIAFADTATWAQAMAAHLWSGARERRDMLVLDPASGTDTAGRLRTTTYNDVARFRWLGARPGTAPLFADSTAGQWVCIEAHVRLEAPGRRDGLFELRVDGRLDARREGLAWVGGSAAYGINALFLENYWNGGAPGARTRVFDDLVVATAPIGCAP